MFTKRRCLTDLRVSAFAHFATSILRCFLKYSGHTIRHQGAFRLHQPRPQDRVHEEMLTQHGRSPERSVHIGVHCEGTEGSEHSRESVTTTTRGHYCSLSSTWYSGEVARTSSPAQAQQRVHDGRRCSDGPSLSSPSSRSESVAAVDSSRTKARLFVNWRAS